MDLALRLLLAGMIAVVGALIMLAQSWLDVALNRPKLAAFERFVATVFVGVAVFFILAAAWRW